MGEDAVDNAAWEDGVVVVRCDGVDEAKEHCFVDGQNKPTATSLGSRWFGSLTASSSSSSLPLYLPLYLFPAPAAPSVFLLPSTFIPTA
jgi:hypothetical protein